MATIISISFFWVDPSEAEGLSGWLPFWSILKTSFSICEWFPQITQFPSLRWFLAHS